MPFLSPGDIPDYLTSFDLERENASQEELGNVGVTVIDPIRIHDLQIPRYINAFWTSRQRQASRIHEISYRACFKPQLPGFFISLVTRPGDIVYDPFSGRGTTAIEAGLHGRRVIANDINPLSRILTYPRFFVPDLHDVEERLLSIPYFNDIQAEIDLSMFYHPATEAEIVSLRQYLLIRESSGTLDNLDAWIRMVATNRLTGHSPGFFSVYTLPPNQAVSPQRQVKINESRNQTPPYRNTRDIILKKTRILTKGVTQKQKENLKTAGKTACFLTTDARNTCEIPDNSVQLTVTSPPFLNIVQYSQDNWLRCWFNGIDDREIGSRITSHRGVDDWSAVMHEVFQELFRITRPEGYVAFEVGEVRNGAVRLDEHIVPAGIDAGFTCLGIIINLQEFTKTANIWGVSNMEGGTNTNRIVLFLKNGSYDIIR